MWPMFTKCIGLVRNHDLSEEMLELSHFALIISLRKLTMLHKWKLFWEQHVFKAITESSELSQLAHPHSTHSAANHHTLSLVTTY